MVKIEQKDKTRSGRVGSAPLPEVRFENARLSALGIEPMTLAALKRKVSARRLAAAQRVDFFMLMLVTGGAGRHTVDFVDWPLVEGSLLVVQPGQVQQWHPEDDFAARLVLIAPNTLPHRSGLSLPRELEALRLDEWQPCIRLDAAGRTMIESGLQQLWRDFDQFDGDPLSIALIRHQLMTLLLRIARQQRRIAEATAGAPDRRIYRMFLQALEADFPRQHALQDYAGRLGYSASTLSRACRAAEGRPAKEVIDRRVALEAQRLLVHSTGSVAEIAHQLGFSEATNFVKFFRRVLGVTPADFRRAFIRPAPS